MSTNTVYYKSTRNPNQDGVEGSIDFDPLTSEEMNLLRPSVKPLALHAISLVGAVFYSLRTCSLKALITSFAFYKLADKKGAVAFGILLTTFVFHALFYHHKNTNLQHRLFSFCKKNMKEGDYTYFDANGSCYIIHKNGYEQFVDSDEAIDYRNKNANTFTHFVPFEQIVPTTT